jgi:hypothetical protein
MIHTMPIDKPLPETRYAKWQRENKDKSPYYRVKFSYPPSD